MHSRRMGILGRVGLDSNPPPSEAVRARDRTGLRIALFMPSLRGGGAERVMIDLAERFGNHGFFVDIVVVNGQNPVMQAVGQNVRVVDLNRRRTALSGFALYRYLKKSKPSVLMGTVENTNALAAIVSLFVPGLKLVLREASSLKFYELGGSLRTWISRLVIRRSYRVADCIVAVSEQGKEELTELLGPENPPIHVIPNPVLTERVFAGAQSESDHPWLSDPSVPVVLGVGRLAPEKGFDTLVRAFAEVLQRRDARLIILGEGAERQALEALAKSLAIEGKVDFHGFANNPFAFMAGARLFVLSSRTEGLPNVLIQALAISGNVVATDCETGPREILDAGTHGALVEVDDVEALANAIVERLDEPGSLPPESWYERYDANRVVERYLDVLLSGLG